MRMYTGTENAKSKVGPCTFIMTIFQSQNFKLDNVSMLDILCIVHQ